MSERLPAELQRLERALVRHDAPVVERLQPPVGASAIANAEQEIGFTLAGDIRILFDWHDGNQMGDRPGAESIGSTGFSFISLEVAVAFRQKELDETRGEYQNREEVTDRWHDRWFPVMGGGPFYAVWVSCLTPTSQQVLIGDIWSGRGVWRRRWRT